MFKFLVTLQNRTYCIPILGNENVHLYLLDMSNPKKVYEFATEFKQSGKPLNVLVNNAGCLANQRTVNEYNLEVNFVTNTLGTYILTESLIELLQTQVNPQVITVTSGKYVNFTNFNFMDPFLEQGLAA